MSIMVAGTIHDAGWAVLCTVEKGGEVLHEVAEQQTTGSEGV